MAQSTESHVHRAMLLGRQGRHAEAAARLQEAVRVEPTSVVAWLNLGVALEKGGRFAEAAEAYRRTLQLRPNLAKAHRFMGNALRHGGRWHEAEEAERRAIELAPEDPVNYSNLATTLSAMGRLDEVIACRRKAVQLQPASPSAGSALLTALHYHGSSTPAQLLAEARQWASRCCGASGPIAPHDNDRSIHRRLRIGFLSGNAAAHPEGRLLRAVLAHLDRDRFESFVYCNLPKPDAITAALRGLTDQWREIAPLSDQQADALIRTDQIDILLDLTGHFGHGRLTLLALKPAPVQATWFGYPGTSGLDTIDWRITDPLSDPPQADGTPYTTEKPWRLPCFSWCYEAPLEARAVASRPLEPGRPITFICPNNPLKVSAEAIETWAHILRAVPRSRLELLAEGGANFKATDPRQHYFHERFAAYGIGPEQVELKARQDRPRYFEWIHSADIALDPFPYNGGVSTCDTLWMGVPVVALAGNAYWSRQGQALLTEVDLSDLVGTSKERYIAIATGIASDPQRLKELRAGLRQKMREASISDCSGFAGHLSGAFGAMWRRWVESGG